MTAFLDLLKEKIIIFDGAMGTFLQSLNLSIDDWGGPNFENCSENLLYTRPDAIETVHKSFLDVGCDVIETNSFGGSEVVLTTSAGYVPPPPVASPKAPVTKAPAQPPRVKFPKCRPGGPRPCRR